MDSTVEKRYATRAQIGHSGGKVWYNALVGTRTGNWYEDISNADEYLPNGERKKFYHFDFPFTKESTMKASYTENREEERAKRIANFNEQQEANKELVETMRGRPAKEIFSHTGPLMNAKYGENYYKTTSSIAFATPTEHKPPINHGLWSAGKEHNKAVPKK